VKKSTRKIEKKARKLNAAKVARKMQAVKKNSRKRLTPTTPVVITIPTDNPKRPAYLVRGAIRSSGLSLKLTQRKTEAMKPIAQVAHAFMRMLGLDAVPGARLMPV